MLQRLIRAWAPRLVLLAVLALAVLVVFSGNTQARYTSDTAQTSDSARVAKWNVSLTTAEDQADTLTLNQWGDKTWYEDYTFEVSSSGCEVALSYGIEVSNLPKCVTVYLVEGETVTVDADGKPAYKEGCAYTSPAAKSTARFEQVGTFAPGETAPQTWTLRFEITSGNATSFTQNTIGVSVNAEQID